MPDSTSRRLADLTDPEAVRAAMRRFDEAGGIDEFIADNPASASSRLSATSSG